MTSRWRYGSSPLATSFTNTRLRVSLVFLDPKGKPCIHAERAVYWLHSLPSSCCARRLCSGQRKQTRKRFSRNISIPSERPGSRRHQVSSCARAHDLPRVGRRSGAIDGKYVFASEGEKSNLLCKINATGFRGEQFIYDGNKVNIAGTYLDKSRSEFGDFLINQDIPIRENLLGGVWSSGWPLLNLERRGAKLHNEGLKKVDGRDLIVLRYQPKKRTDLSILLIL